MSSAPTSGKNTSNKITIEKDKKFYCLNISNDEKEITFKFRIEKPLKVYEKKYSQKDLEQICKLFKGCDNISECYEYIHTSLENKQFVLDIKDEAIKIKLNNLNIFEFKEMIIPEKEIDIPEKIENLYSIQEDLLKEIKDLKLENENLKKEIQLIKNDKENGNKIKENELIDVKLINGSSNFGSGYRKFYVHKTSNNIVKLSGLINCTLGQVICTLPENCRPKQILIFNCMANDKSIRVDVYGNGNVYPYGSGSVWLSLDNISFISAI